jgi:3D-(3,5/4)-trihydroxycyclohexane-1,2-dione acylhydrolase (decyclizing)
MTEKKMAIEDTTLEDNGRRTTVCLTMGQALVQYLQAQHSERDGKTQRLIPAALGIFGHGNASGLGQAVYEYGRDLKFYQPCNEQSMVHTAIGFAKASFRKSTLACAASIGPGSTNMVTGAATATINRLPVLLLAADYYATRHQGPVLQQLEHPISADVSVNDCFRPVSRFFDRISRPEQLLTALPEAMRVLTDPADTGAVTLALPQDVQAHAYDYPVHFFDKRVWRIERRLPDPQRIEEAVALLKTAKRPFLIAGGGVHYSEAWAELAAFSKALGIPVGETFAGKAAFRQESELLLGGVGVTGNPAAGAIASQADLVICVGTRLTDFSTGSHSLFQNHDVRFIHINVCAHDAYKIGALPVLADAREGLRALQKAAQEAGIQPQAGHVREVATIRSNWRKTIQDEVLQQVPGEAMSQGQLIGVLNAAAQDGDTVIAAAGSPPGDLHNLWDASKGRHAHLEFGYSCMAYEIPASLGVRMAQPRGEVFVLIGDGTYLMNPTELVTAAREGLKVTVVLSENHGYQCIRNLQLNRVGHDLATEFKYRNPATGQLDGDYARIDFAKNAESMGARAWKVRTPDELGKALAEARAETQPCVIVAETEKLRFLPGSKVWWDVAVSETSNDSVTQGLRKAYEGERKNLQRFYY